MSSPAIPIVYADEILQPLTPVANTVHVEQIVEVYAPCDLDAGCSFQACYNDTIFTVVVPSAVRAGDRIQLPFQPSTTAIPIATEAVPLITTVAILPSAPLQPLSSSLLNNGYESTQEEGEIRGRWKDGLCDCCSPSVGCCHPSCFMALCFPRLLNAQILTRMKMDIFANPTNDDNVWRKTFRRMFLLVVTFFVYRFIFSCPNPYLDKEAKNHLDITIPDCPKWLRSLNVLVSTAFGLYTIIILIKTRRAIRKRYQIPARSSCCCGLCCDGIWEDICCSVVCNCCVLAQLARHTAHYRRYRATCCTSDGLGEP